MRMHLQLFFLLCLVSISSFANKVLTVTSPDNQIRFSLSSDSHGLYYRVAYKSTLVVDKSRLNMVFKEGGGFDHNLVIGSAKPQRLTEDYTLLIGKTSKVHSECNRMLVGREA